jgi:hypothetical protein
MSTNRLVLIQLVVVAGLWLFPANAAVADRPPLAGSTPPPSSAGPSMPVQYVGKLTLAPTHGLPGTIVTATGSGLPPNAEMELMWGTVKGRWVLKGTYNEEYHGREFAPVNRPLKQIRTDEGGHLQTTFTVPQDFGYGHDVIVVHDGVIRNQAAFDIDMQASAAPASGPVGTPIQIVLAGVGWRDLENSWMLVYDNRFTGWLSSVTTGGVARAVIPATGSPGKHVIQIIHGAFTVPYMNMQQTPHPDRPTFTFQFSVIPGKPVLPPAASSQSLPVRRGAAPAAAGAAVWTDLTSGSVGTAFRLQGRDLPPGETVEVSWGTVVGNRVGGSGWADATRKLGTSVVDARGTFALPLKVPDDLGGPHAITARIGTRTMPTTFTITPSALALQPASGPVGATFRVHLKGIGWTETANIYHLVYDNAYVGYSCGFNSQGDIEVFMKATGTPGWHFIDMYPGIYKGKEVPGVQNFRIPQLTYATDHPGETLPAFRFAFLVTKSQ